MFDRKFSPVMQRSLQRNSYFRFLFTFLVAANICFVSVYAQTQVNQNWYFGNGPRAIQFSQPGDTARLISRPTAGVATYGNAGGAVASDPTTGGLLFYTDGSTVHDATHRPMPNGSGLLGNPNSNQPAVIVQVPGQTNRYYIITNDAAPGAPGKIRYTEVDMTLQGNNAAGAPPLGDVNAVKATDAGITTLDNESEAMIVIPHENGTDFWLITHEAGTGSFNVSTITATGITAPATATSVVPNSSFSATQFAYHAASGRIAIAPSDPNQNVVILNFNSTTGALTFNEEVFNSAVTSNVTQPAIYDVEFSNDGDFLYVSRQGDTGVNADLLQFDLVNDNVSPATVLSQPVAKSYGIQIAPDSSVYHLYQATTGGPFLVGRITDPDTVATQVNYEANAFPTATALNFNSKQFPSFLVGSEPQITLNFTSAGECANAPTTFFPTVEPAADSLAWDFDGQGAGSTNWSPTHTYTAGGNYPVTLFAIVGGDTVAQVTKTIAIRDFDLQINLVQDTTACSCELPFPKADPPPTTGPNGQPCNPFTLTAEASGQTGQIQWFGPSGLLQGQNTLTLSKVDSAGFYYVQVSDPSGQCFAYAGVNIKEYGVEDPRSNIWYFGNNAGMNFNPDFRPTTGADAIQGDIISSEGVAVICDANGQIIISTNGEQVLDRDGNPAPPLPPGALGSQESTQSALIIPFPGDPTLYYIFTTDKVYPDPADPNGYELRYAIFDLKRGTNGQLVPMDPPANTTYSAVLFTRSTERITGNENWLIAHEYGTNNFRAYPITPQGIGAPVISSVGSDHSVAVREHAEGYMKLSPNNILAVALATPGTSNIVELFDFDNATGVVSNPRQVDLGTPNGQVYGIEFSPSGTKLFASTKGAGASALFEFAYDSTTSNYTTRLPIQPPVAGEIGAIERGPDGTIYVATNGANALGTINANPNITLPSTFNPTGFQLLGGTSSTLGLPNFIQNIADPVQTPSISVAGTCINSPSTFTGSGTDVIDTLTWVVDGAIIARGANLTEVEHTFTVPGQHIIRLEISNRCVGFVDALVDTVEIGDIPPVLSGAETLCTGTEAIEAIAANDPNLADYTYEWSTGATTRTIIPPGQAIYNVTVRNSFGCTADGEWLVSDNRPQVELGPDQTVCQNSGTITLDASNFGATYEWRRNGAVVGSAQTIGVSTQTASPPSFEYLVVVSDAFTGCTARDSVTFTINPEPTFTTAFTNPSNCGVADGVIQLSITSSGTFQYNVIGTTPVTPGSDITGPSGLVTASNALRAGAYNIIVANQVTGCDNSAVVGLSDAAFTASIQAAQQCNDPATGNMPVQLTTTAGTPYAYRIINQSNGNAAASGTGNSPSITTSPVPRGSYFVEVRSPNDATGCVFVSPSPVMIEQALPNVPIDDVEIEECDPPFSIEVITSVATATYAWSGNGIPPTQVNASQIFPTVTGPQAYRLILAATGTHCPEDTTINVNIQPAPRGSISQSDPCQDDVILSASPTGNYVYRWFRNGVQFQGGQQISISNSDNGVTYAMDARNTINGCIVSADTVVTVLGELTVDITNPAPCFGTDFTLTANTNQTPDLFTWAFNNANIANATGSTLAVTDDRSGLYRVTVRRNGANNLFCQAKDSVQIFVAPTTAGVLPDNGIICPDPSNTDPATSQLVLNPGPDFISYNWFRDGIPLNVTTPTYTATDIGTYSVDLVNFYNCPSSDRITLREECDPKITGPNAFRPGGLNQNFYLFTFFISDEDFEIFIFNRWGEMVFYSDERDFRWNGTNPEGAPLPPGTYSYVVKYKSSYRPELGIEEARGGVVLLR
jgi:large repetitive protein